VGGVAFEASSPSFEVQAGVPVTAPFNTTIITGDGTGAVWTVPVTGPVSISWSPVFIPLAMGPVSATSIISDVIARPGPGVAFAGAQPLPGADLIVARLPNPNGTSIQDGFVNSVNQQLLIAAIVVGAAALLLAWLLSRRILRPVEALTAAAGRMERGDLSARVDVTSKDEIGKLAHAFNAMSDSMARQEELRRNMVTDIAHELRTPLSNIRGYLEAVRDGVVQPDPALIGSLHEESLLLSRLVEDLQELQLAEAGQLKIERQLVDVPDMIASASTALAATAEEKGVCIDTDAPTSLPSVYADPARIGQVLRNLIDNAITHTPADGAIRIAARATNREVEIRVQDTGPGIHPDHLTHIFDRFYRADASRARSTGGAGLGLAIVKQLIELHNGQVWAESPPNQGATFYFTLPIYQLPAAQSK
jgi:signal transduction histidine kinase